MLNDYCGVAPNTDDCYSDAVDVDCHYYSSYDVVTLRTLLPVVGGALLFLVVVFVVVVIIYRQCYVTRSSNSDDGVTTSAVDIFACCCECYNTIQYSFIRSCQNAATYNNRTGEICRKMKMKM